ncbi:MAG: hypothetical protein J5I53_03860 [Bradyrhizobiaceae bacterium]|nr:hypothetical protein [Bradyrhizobiaceae bacterium]
MTTSRRVVSVLTIALLLIITGFTSAFAQNKFKVLAVRGNVMNGAKKCTLGQPLSTSDKLTIQSGGYVSLAHINGRTTEIRKPGTYKVADLDKAAQKKTSTAVGKFAANVFSELTDVQEPVSFTNSRRSNMRTTGSVERAAGDDVNAWDSILVMVGAPGELQALAALQDDAITSGSELIVRMPRHTRMLADTVTFVWHRSTKPSAYKLVVVDRTNKQVFQTEVRDTQFVSTVSQLGLGRGQLYYWHVESTTDASLRSTEYALYWLDGVEQDNAQAVLQDIRESCSSETEAIGMLIEASAMEDMGLMYEAHKTFASAASVAPDVQNYKRMFAEFLLRRGLTSEAYSVYR